MSFDAVAFLENLFVDETNPIGETASVEQLATQWSDFGPDDLPADWRLWFEERAAIREYEGGQPRELAEAEALTETVRRMKAEEMNQNGGLFNV